MTLDTAIPFLRAPVADLPADDPIRTALRVARETLGMEVSFFAELTDRHMVFRALDGDRDSFGWHEAQEVPLDAAYCTLMVRGELPEVIPEVRENPVAMSRAATAAAGIGSYVGVPVWSGDGRLYGSLCCLSHGARPDLDATDARFLHGFAQLVSEQLNREERVLDSFRQIVESTSEGIWTADLEGRTTFVNGATGELLGHAPAEMVGRPVLDFVAPESRADVRTRLARRHDGGRDTYETTLVARDGSRRIVRIGSAPMTGIDGSVRGSLATISDVTEQRRAERRGREVQQRALEEAQEKFRAVADLVPHQIWTAGPDGRVDFANRRAAQYFGGEAIVASGGDWTAFLHPDDRAASVACWEESLATGRPFEVEYRLRRRDGEYRLHHGRAFCSRDDAGVIQRWYGMTTDVTDSRAQERLTDLIAASQDAIIGEDLDGRILSWNPAAERIYGYAAEEVLGRSFAVLMPPDRTAQAEEILAAIRAGRPVHHPAARRRHKDGHDIVVSVTLSPVVDRDGRVTGASAIARDVTEQLRSAWKLRDSEARLLEAQRVARLGSWELDLDGGQVTCSDEARRLLGLPPSPAPLTSRDMIDAVAPQDRERVRGIGEEAFGRGGSFAYDHMVTGDPTTILRAEGRVRREADGSRRVIGTVQDVTDSRRTERELRASQQRLVEAQRVARMGDFVWESGTDAITVSDGMARIVGLEAGEPLPLVAYFQRIPREDRRGVESVMRRAVAAGQPLDCDAPLVRPDGARLIVNVRGEVVLAEDGTPLRVTGTVQDVTASRATEAALQAKEQAERANRAKSEFLSRMSHELRTPLNAILGFGQLLELDDLEPESEESVAHILRAGRHLLELIDEVLDVSRIEAGALRLTLEPVDLDPIIEEVLGLAVPLAGERDVVLHLGTATGLKVLADRQRVRQILLNLVSNAIKYNRPGGRVDLAVAADAGQVRVEVADTGQGIAADDLPRLFSPFERLGAEGGDVAGTGLGLTVSRSLSEGMGGTLDVRSTVGAGSAFTLGLPAAP